jgi:uncharacterized protein YdaT
MPWTGKTFAAKHNRKLKGKSAAKAARIATAMVERGAPEGEAIATANARAEGKPRKKRGDGLRKYAKSLEKRFR